MPFVIAKDPGPVGLWLAKWIFLPLIVLLIVWASIQLTLGTRSCVAACVHAGYEFSSYSPSYWGKGLQAKCVCSDHGVAKSIVLRP